MEIKKAIDILLNSEIAASGTDLGKACHMGRAALRSQQEREKCSYLQPCGWCSNFDKPCDDVCGRHLKEAQEDEK